MIGKGVFRENFQPQSCSGKKAPKTGQVKGKCKNFVISVDDDEVDDDEVDDVVIIDFHEFVNPKKVISVEDDESDDDEIVVEGVGELDSDASSSKRFSPSPSSMQNPVPIDVDDSQVYENTNVSNTRKSRETCSAKANGSNFYDFYGSESDLYESDDGSDCELLEVRELWEKASVKRKRHVFNDESCYYEHPSSSGLHTDNHVNNIRMENSAEQHAGSPVYSAPSNGQYVKENQSTFSSKGDSEVDGIHFHLGTEIPFKDSDQKVDQMSFKFFASGLVEEMQSLNRCSDTEREERTRHEDVSLFTNYEKVSVCGGVSGASRFEKEFGGKESYFMSSSLEACEIQVDNKGSALSCKDNNLSEMKSNRISFGERPVNCDGIGLHAQDDGGTATNEIDIINEREKLKETDEYKRAIEEEWASRQQQLQIQAEEAQRLRKRKKAETKRLLDMQRRQKERLEEVRETQKKDEEFMNMKEQLRVEIRKGLNKLEMQCGDMTSLLRGLGIHIGGGFIPLPNEVQAAYKRALFKFHPDRASKTDIREQVEAEEKFKLISRMKDKLLLTSCH